MDIDDYEQVCDDRLSDLSDFDPDLEDIDIDEKDDETTIQLKIISASIQTRLEAERIAAKMRGLLWLMAGASCMFASPVGLAVGLAGIVMAINAVRLKLASGKQSKRTVDAQSQAHVNHLFRNGYISGILYGEPSEPIGTGHQRTGRPQRTGIVVDIQEATNALAFLDGKDAAVQSLARLGIHCLCEIMDGETIGTAQDARLGDIRLIDFSGEVIQVIETQAPNAFSSEVQLIIQHLADTSPVPVLYRQPTSPPVDGIGGDVDQSAEAEDHNTGDHGAVYTAVYSSVSPRPCYLRLKLEWDRLIACDRHEFVTACEVGTFRTDQRERTDKVKVSKLGFSYKICEEAGTDTSKTSLSGPPCRQWRMFPALTLDESASGNKRACVNLHLAANPSADVEGEATPARGVISSVDRLFLKSAWIKPRDPRGIALEHRHKLLMYKPTQFPPTTFKANVWARYRRRHGLIVSVYEVRMQMDVINPSPGIHAVDIMTDCDDIPQVRGEADGMRCEVNIFSALKTQSLVAEKKSKPKTFKASRSFVIAHP